MKTELLLKVVLPRNQEESHFTCELEKCLKLCSDFFLRCPHDFQPKPSKSHSVFLIFIKCHCHCYHDVW